MGHHAIQTVVGGTGGSDDHLAVAFGQMAVFLEHQSIVVGEERPPFRGATRQRQKHIGNKARFFLHFQHFGADVFGQSVEVGKWVSGHGVTIFLIQSGKSIAFCLGKSTQMVVAPPAA